MNDEDKLRKFYEITIKEAKSQNTNEVNSYEAALEKSFIDHKEEMERKAELEIRLQQEVLQKHKNSETAVKQLELRKVMGDIKDRLKEELFMSIKERLIEYKNNDDYINYLNNCVRKALSFAKGVKVDFYIDSSDVSLINQINNSVNLNIEVSEENLIGGMRAAIPSKNVLIDESFSAKLLDEQRKFKF